MAKRNPFGFRAGFGCLAHLRLCFTVAAICCLSPLRASAQAAFTALYTFSASYTTPVGTYPFGLALSANGYFYGVCVNAGADEWGAIYQMSATGAATGIYEFTDKADGAEPSAGLVLGTNGLYYGMAASGGSNGYGSIFSVKTNGTFTSLHAFAALKVKTGTSLVTNSDGSNPEYALVLNTNNNNFYGTCPEGGTNSFGSIFQMTHQGKVTVFYAFSNLVDGGTPLGPLMVYTNGYIFGTAAGGGSNGCGTVFKMSSNGVYKAIYSFTNGVDGATPQGPLVDGKDGFLYGTCSAGGTYDTGTIFKITTNGVLTPLYSFSEGTNFPSTGGVQNEYNSDGINPNYLLLGSDNNFYGLCYYGSLNGSGSVFQFTRSGTFNLLYAFNYSANNQVANVDGANPTGLFMHPNGNFYGVCKDGGINQNGTFFTIGLPPTITTQPTNVSISLGSNAVFAVAAASTPACQWQFDGTNLPNATNYSLHITNAQIANAGFYDAVLTNINGAVTSAVVTLNLTNVQVSFMAGASALQYSGGQFSMYLTNLTGQGEVIVQSSSDLKNWTGIFTNPPGFGSLPIVDTNGAINKWQFYRMVVP